MNFKRRETNKLTRVIIVRHCEAYGNYERIFQGHSDSGITENGKIQGKLIAERFKDIHYDAIYSSPLMRTYKTAEFINTYHKLPIIKDKDLIEINGGHWEGEKWADLPELFPEEAYAWANEPWKFVPLGGEKMTEVYDRIWKKVLEIVKKHTNNTVCIVSHGCAIRNFLCRAQGLPITELNTIDWCDNTGVNIIDFDKDLNPEIILYNDVSHLDKDTSTLQNQSWWKRDQSKELRFE